jgi:hypothetical protein
MRSRTISAFPTPDSTSWPASTTADAAPPST